MNLANLFGSRAVNDPTMPTGPTSVHVRDNSPAGQLARSEAAKAQQRRLKEEALQKELDDAEAAAFQAESQKRAAIAYQERMADEQARKNEVRRSNLMRDLPEYVAKYNAETAYHNAMRAHLAKPTDDALKIAAAEAAEVWKEHVDKQIKRIAIQPGSSIYDRAN